MEGQVKYYLKEKQLETLEECETYQFEAADQDRRSITFSVIIVTGQRSSHSGQSEATNTPGGKVSVCGQYRWF